MFQATIVKINPLGEPDEKFGTRYWGEFNDDLTPFMFSSHRDFAVGDSVMYEEKTMKKSAKGTTYWALKGVKKLETTTDTPQPEEAAREPLRAPQNNSQLDRLETSLQELHSKMDKLLGWDEDLSRHA